MTTLARLLIIAIALVVIRCQPLRQAEEKSISVISSDSLTMKLVPIYVPKIEYPDLPRKVGIEGEALIQCLIDTNGLVINTSLLKSSGNKMLDSVALKETKSFKFNPPRYRGKPVRVVKQIGIRFHNVFKTPKGEVSIFE